MEKTQKITAQIYGYAVCLVAVITFIFTTITIVNALIDLSDPMHAGWTAAGSPSLASYENYKLDVMRMSQKETTDSKTGYLPDEPTLKAMFESAKNDKLNSSKHQSTKSLIIGGIITLISIILFITHWRWMRRFSKPDN